MTIFDLLFLVLFLTVLLVAIRAGIAALRGRREQAFLLLRRLALGGGLYLAVIAIVSLLSPRRERAMAEEQCSDDWCISVTNAQRIHGSDADTVEVTFRLASRAARASQREQYVVAYLRDGAGHRYDPAPSDGAAPFDVLLGPLEVVTTIRHFTVPSAAKDVGVVIAREGAGWFPRCCIIGDEDSFLYKRSVVRLP